MRGGSESKIPAATLYCRQPLFPVDSKVMAYLGIGPPRAEVRQVRRNEKDSCRYINSRRNVERAEHEKNNSVGWRGHHCCNVFLPAVEKRRGYARACRVSLLLIPPAILPVRFVDRLRPCPPKTSI